MPFTSTKELTKILKLKDYNLGANVILSNLFEINGTLKGVAFACKEKFFESLVDQEDFIQVISGSHVSFSRDHMDISKSLYIAPK